MPIYEYRCQQCGHELEKLQRMSDAPLVDCPACENPALKRLISAAGFRLKGAGWYETDFKQGQKRNLADGGESKKEKPAETRSDAGGSEKPTEPKAGKTKPDTSASKATPASGNA